VPKYAAARISQETAAADNFFVDMYEIYTPRRPAMGFNAFYVLNLCLQSDFWHIDCTKAFL